VDIFKRIDEIASSEEVRLAGELKELLHKELVLGQTRYVCRHGTLSDGHEKVTDAQRYYQSIREIYTIRSSMINTKARAMETQADLLDAKELPEETPSQKLRKKAAILSAEEALLSHLITVEDQARMIDEYNKVRLELMDKVRAKYPEGIEQAEADNWEAVFRYRMIKGKSPMVAPERVDNVPLSPEHKARLGIEFQRVDAVAPKLVKEGLGLKALSEMNHNDFLLTKGD